MYYSYGYQSEVQSAMIIMAVSLIIALIGAFVLYFLFLSPKNDRRFTGFVGWLYDFLSFKKLMLEGLLKIIYLFCTLLITFSGLIFLFKQFFAGLLLLVIGNILIRFIYEFAILRILVCKNTSEINSKMNELIKNGVFTASGEQGQSNDSKREPEVKAEPPKPDPNICPTCGTKLKPTAKFCPGCGSPVVRP